ncbi:glycosyltransferase family 25 protein [Acidimangrovimonas pyrenivorans]|uniref:Glycosyltransferase family 25 protein n=1 Tax=Acidimangrovimonas pyrenivorans TaxID=2030798 RepID=A0ABV7AD10_9RHOB
MTETAAPWPVLVVSLADAQARRRALTAQLEALSIPFRFVDAVDGRNGLAARYETMIDRPGTEVQFGRPLADAEYACALSHLSLYRRIVDEDLPGAIVLEDDARVGPLFAEFLRGRGFEAADLIQLDHLHGDVWRFGTQTPLTGGIRIVRAARNASLTTGYSISRRGAAHILDHALPLRGPADWPCDVTALPAMLALPRVVDHPRIEPGTSDIEKARASLVTGLPQPRRGLRFFRAAYWRRWWFKRRTRRVS